MNLASQLASIQTSAHYLHANKSRASAGCYPRLPDPQSNTGKVLDALQSTSKESPAYADDLARRLGIPQINVSIALYELRKRGYAQDGGGRRGLLHAWWVTD